MTLRGGRRLASRGGLALAGLLALVLLLAGLLHIPSVQGAIRTRLAREAGRALSAEVEVASLRWDLFRGLVSAGGLVVRGRDARSGTALSVESVRLSFSPAELLRGRLRLRQVRIVRPEARLRLDAGGGLVLPFLVPASEEKPKRAGRPDVALEELRLEEGRLELLDEGPSGRRIEASGVTLTGSGDLPTPSTKGSLVLPRLVLAAAGKAPLEETSIRLEWELSGGSGRFGGRVEGKGTGLAAVLSGTLTGLADVPRYEATLKVTGSLGPLAARLVPGWSLAGTVETETTVRGAFGAGGAGGVAGAAGAAGAADKSGDPGAWPDVRASLHATELVLFGRKISRLELSGEISGRRLVAATVLATSGRGSARLEASGTLFPSPEGISFRARLENVELDGLLGPLPGGRRVASLLSGSVDGLVAIPTLAGTTLSSDLSLAAAGSVPARGASPSGRARARLEKGILRVDELTLRDRGTTAELAGSWSFSRSSFEGRLDADSTDLAPWLALAGLSGGGSASAHLSGSGTIERPLLEGSARARSLVVQGFRVESLSFDARLADRTAALSNGAVDAYGIEAELSGEGTLGSPRGKRPEAQLRLTGITFRGRRLPDVTADATFGKGMAARLATSDGRVKASAELAPDGSLRCDASFDRVDLAPVTVLLPPGWHDAEGELSGHVEASRDRAGAPLRTAFRVDAMTAGARGRRVATRQPAEGSVDGNRIRIGSISLAGDDGSSFALSGSASLDGGALDLAGSAEIPELGAWAHLVPGESPIGGSLSVDVRLTGSLRQPRARGHGSARRLAFGDARVDSASVTFDPVPGRDDATSIHLALSGAAKGELPFPDVTADAILAGESVTVAATALDGRLRLSGSSSLERPWPATAELFLSEVPVGSGPLARAAGVPKGVEAVLGGRAKLRGPLARPTAVEAEVELSRVEISSKEGTVSAAEPVRLSLSGGRLEVRSLRLAGKSLDLDASGALPLEGPGKGRLLVRANLGLAALLPFVPALDRAQGRLAATLEAAGSLARPSFTGRLELSGGLLDGPAFPAALEALAGSVSATETGVTIDSFSARVAGGSVTLSGSLGLDGMRPGRLHAALRARDVDLSIGDDLQIRAGADLAASGTWPSLALKGEIRIADATYIPSVDLTGMLRTLVSRKGQDTVAPARGSKEHLPVSVALDVALIAPDAIHVEGQMAEAELGGTLQLKGTVDSPIVLGNVASTRGTVNLFGSVFDLTRARLQFTSPVEIDPELDIVGTTTKGDDEITVRVSGRASKAQLLFSSSSGKSQSDVLRELFGGSGTGSTSVATAGARMAMAGATAPILGSLSKKTAFQLVPLPTTAEGEDFLFSVGKDLGGGLTVTYFKGLSGETSDAFELRWRLSSTGRGRVRQNQDGSLSGGFRIRREFH